MEKSAEWCTMLYLRKQKNKRLNRPQKGEKMRVLTKQEMKYLPNGTVFVEFTPEIFTGDIHVITGRNEGSEGWNGELPLRPWLEQESDNTYYTQWSTVDNTWWELDDHKKYAVFSPNEILKLIECLQWALTGCKTYFNQDEWWGEFCKFPLPDNEVLDD